jgi:hypothetical protein
MSTQSPFAAGSAHLPDRSVTRNLDAARAATCHSYAEARRLVYDVIPPGPVDETTLSEQQQQALSNVRFDEKRLAAMRMAAWAPRVA